MRNKLEFSENSNNSKFISLNNSCYFDINLIEKKHSIHDSIIIPWNINNNIKPEIEYFGGNDFDKMKISFGEIIDDKVKVNIHMKTIELPGIYNIYYKYNNILSSNTLLNNNNIIIIIESIITIPKIIKL